MRASAKLRCRTFGRQLGASWLWGSGGRGPLPQKPVAHHQEEIKAGAQGLMDLRLFPLRSFHQGASSCFHGPLMMGTSSLPSARETIYTEQKQALDIKPKEFYEREAAEFHRYFYYVDLQGRLYLEDTLPKTAATCLNAPKAVNAFFKSLQRNDTAHHSDYPYVSPCGHWETNYIKAAAVPVVFTDLIWQHGTAPQPLPSSEATEGGDVLCYAAGLTAPFDPGELRVCPRTGMLFHRLRTRRMDTMGLIRSQLAQELGASIDLADDANNSTVADADADNDDRQQEGRGKVMGRVRWRGRVYRLLALS